MMSFADLPIQRKLFGSVILGVSVAALVLALSVFIYERKVLRPGIVEGARANAKMLAELLLSSIEFSDENSARMQLASIDWRPETLGSAIYLPDGSQFVGRNRRPEGRFPERLENPAALASIERSIVTVIEPIRSGSEIVGWLGIKIEIPGAQQHIYGYGIFVLASILAFGVLALLLSYVLSRAVTGPIQNLMKAAHAVSEKKNYALRVPVGGKDEVGRLAGAFNEMLAAIGSRDDLRHRHEMRLARHNSGLVELAQTEVQAQGDPELQLRLVLAILSRVHRVQRVGFWLFEDSDTRMRCVAAYDREKDGYFDGGSLAVGAAPAYFAAVRSEVVLAISDTATDPIVAELRTGYLEPAGITSMLDLPVRRHGRLAGVLCHEHVGPARHWEAQEINFAAAVSDRVVLILESAELHEAQRALRQSEAHYREMVEAAPDAIFTIDAGGRIREPNTALSRLTRWPESHWRDVSLADALYAPDRMAASQACEDVATNGRSKVLVLRFMKADGCIVSLECYLAPRRDATGLRSVLCVGRDQTERLSGIAAQAKLEEQLRHAQKMQAVGTLAGGIAHDFNNILTSLMGNLELMSYEIPAGQRVRSYLDNTMQASLRARDLVRQILTFSRRQDSRREPLDLATIVGEALGLLRASLPTTIEIVSRLDAGLPLILADATQIHQVVMNLATNAFHAMAASGGRLTIEVGLGSVDEPRQARHPQLRLGDYVILTVIDTGCGMDDETERRLFEPFFTTKPPGQGTGLGMAVVHGILESHDAMISVQSEPGKGTAFRLFFPILGEGIAATVPGAGTSLPQRLEGSGRVLLIDDEASVAQVAEILLKRSGLSVESFGDPRAAILEFEANPVAFDLVVTDFTMPHLNGLDLTRRMLSLRPDLPIIIMTGYGGDNNAEVFAAAGVHVTLEKPFTADSFNQAVAAAMRSRNRVG